MSIDHSKLANAALEARKASYAPYSGYEVGAAIIGADGRIWTGCNVENASYGLTICAERAAVCRMAADGGRQIAAVAVATPDGGPPCGACLQVLSEFIPKGAKVHVFCIPESGTAIALRFEDLFPVRFGSEGFDPRR